LNNWLSGDMDCGMGGGYRRPENAAGDFDRAFLLLLTLAKFFHPLFRRNGAHEGILRLPAPAAFRLYIAVVRHRDGLVSESYTAPALLLEGKAS
jgi:hypothetical protein